MGDIWCGMEHNKQLSQCTVYRSFYDSMDCEIVYQKKKDSLNGALLFYDNRYILFENMDVVDIACNKVVMSIHHKHSRTAHGYHKFAYISNCGHYLCMVYSERIFIIDLFKNEVCNVYDDKNCSYAEIVGDRIIISTWSRVYCLDFKTTGTSE